MIIQNLVNLPNELKNVSRYFPLKNFGDSSLQKSPAIKNWQNRENQKKYTEINGPSGFDIVGRNEGEISYIVFDFDHVLQKETQKFVTEEAENIFKWLMQSLNTFAEISQSGEGIHVIAIPTAGKFSKMTNNKEHVYYLDNGSGEKSKERPKLEIFYNSTRYFIFTGNCFHCNPQTQIAYGEKVDQVINELLNKIKKQLNAIDKKMELKALIDKYKTPTMERNNFPQNNSEKDDDIDEILSYIDPNDVTYDEWIKVGMCLKNSGYNVYVWDEWSQKDTFRYNKKEGYDCFTKWNTFRGTGLTIATLVKMAKDNGMPTKHPKTDTEKAQEVLNKTFEEKRILAFADGNVEFYDKDDPEGIKRSFGYMPKDPNKSRYPIKTKESFDLSKWNVSTYLTKDFEADIAWFKKFSTKRTGYSNIDEKYRFLPGLYVLGAIPSLGKTTFAFQMADQLAIYGENVIYFSYEQTRFELISKGISRFAASNVSDENKVLSSSDIRSGRGTDIVKTAIERYRDIAQHEYIVEADFNLTIKDIADIIEENIVKMSTTPIIFIDYLQVIAPTIIDGRPLNTKENIDHIVKAIKSLQKKHNLVVFLISSLNRQNYLSQIDYESFKESGGIEYTADVIFGLQLSCLSEDPLFKEQNNLNKKREAIREAKKASPREVELVCLKNRFYAPGERFLFEYYPKFDTFEAKLDPQVQKFVERMNKH